MKNWLIIVVFGILVSACVDNSVPPERAIEGELFKCVDNKLRAQNASLKEAVDDFESFLLRNFLFRDNSPEAYQSLLLMLSESNVDIDDPNFYFGPEIYNPELCNECIDEHAKLFSKTKEDFELRKLLELNQESFVAEEMTIKEYAGKLQSILNKDLLKKTLYRYLIASGLYFKLEKQIFVEFTIKPAIQDRNVLLINVIDDSSLEIEGEVLPKGELLRKLIAFYFNSDEEKVLPERAKITKRVIDGKLERLAPEDEEYGLWRTYEKAFEKMGGLTVLPPHAAIKVIGEDDELVKRTMSEIYSIIIAIRDEVSREHFSKGYEELSSEDKLIVNVAVPDVVERLK